MVSSRSLSIGMKPRLHSKALCFISLFLLLFAFCAGSTVASAATPAYVQQCNQYTAGGGSGATASCTLSGVGAGHTLVIGVWTTDSALSSVTASSGTPANAIPAFNDNGYGYTYAYFLANTSSGNITVSATETGYYDPVYISVSEFSNVATSSPLDVTGTGQQNVWAASEISTGSFTTTAASDMLWSLCAGLSGETFSVGTAPITWTQISNTAPSPVLFVEYGVAGSAGSYTGQCYKSSTGYDTSIITVALKPAPTTPAATPAFSPASGTYTSPQTVTVSDSTSGSTIYYTTNGTTPSTSSSVYSSPLPVSTSQTIEAIATASGYTQSAVGSAAYTINLPAAATPTFNPAAGTYAAAQTVTISDSTSGANIYYTTNGSTPTTTSTVYSSPITVSVNETVKAVAIASGYTLSATGSAAYAIEAATPTFSPAAGTYTSAQTVTISDGTSGATIYYTTNGTTPTSSSTKYSSPITVSVNETLKAIATASGYTQSPVGSAAYAIEAATPAFSPAAGTYTSAQTVTISDGTSGATIYYTTNGSTPTTGSTVYSSAITVSINETVKAVAIASGYTLSPVGSAAYSIEATTPTFSPGAGTYTSIQTVTISDGTSGATIYYTTNGTTPTTSSSVYSSPVTVGATETLEAIALASGYTQSPVGSAAYTINLPAAATPTFSPAAGTYASAQTVTISDGTSGATIYYTTNGSTPTTGSTVYSSPISVSVTETVKAIALANGYTQSPVGSAAYTINLPAATPTFSPAAGTYSSAQTVTISDGTSGATIYYTTNGITPTTSSSVYSSAITVSVNETLEAIATASGYSQSAVGSAVYAIEAATPTFSPAAGTYSSAQTVTISDGTSGATIYYTTNGSTPTTSSSVYSSPISVSASETVKAIATASGYTQSPVGSAAYTIDSAGPPAYVQSCNSYTAGQGNSQTASCTLSGVTAGDALVIGIFTTDATLSSVTSSVGTPASVISDYAGNNGYESVYLLPNAASGSITISVTETGYYDPVWMSATEYANITTSPFDASASASTANSSWGAADVNTGNFNTTAANDMLWTMCVGLSGETFTAGTAPITWTQRITTSNYAVDFEEDGLASTAGTYYGQCYKSSTGYDQDILTVALKASSGSGSAAATPTFSPAAGTYTSAQTVTISDSTSGATIYYTTNGTTPTTSSSVYSSAISVSATETLEAIATASGYMQSAVGSAAYTLQAATPTFSPAAGTYASAQTVTISDSTSGAAIYYTTNGTTPTTSSAVYSSAISVSATETLEAMATHSGYTNSAVGSAAYTIGSSSVPIKTVQHNSGSTGSATSLAVAFNSNVTSGNLILVAVSTYDAETLDTPTDTQGNSFTQLVTAGTSGDSVAAIYAATAKSSGADTVTCNISAANNIHCHIYEVQGATATVDQTGNSTQTATALTVSTSAQTTNADDFVFAYFSDNGNATTYTAGSGLGDIEMTDSSSGDSGFSEDKVVIATGTQTATATASAADTFVNVIVALKTSGTPTVSTPTFSPAAGTYTSAVTVTLSDWTAGETIYYTTNGTTPTTSSAVYSSPISVSVTQTVEAIATSSGFANSAVGSAVYAITPPAATPTFSPAAGTYSLAQSVTIGDGTTGATIYYTTNGTMPTTGSSVYSSAINVSASETLEAIAIANGYTQSAVGSAAYAINPAATPTFSPAAGTYSSAQTVTISDSTSGSTIYYTTNGTTPTTSSTRYSSAITVSASETLEAMATASGYSQSAVAAAAYTINSGSSGTCDGMSLGTSVAGTADLNGFVPFQSATGMTTLWNTNIANAAVDPNNAAIQTTAGYSGLSTHVNFGSSPDDGGIPFMIVDSSQTPSVPIYVYDYASMSDNVVAPYPNNVPIEGAAADCSGWPDTYQSDSHTNVLDRATCWDYETYNTNRCNGLYDASEEAIWDMQNGEMRPWGWTSTDAAGLSVMAGLVKYDEAASGHINHAIRFTMQQTKNDANDGYFVEPASHAAGTTYGAPSVEGMRVRLKSSFNISGYSTINQAILTALQQYGMIMADNGGYFFIQGATDSRWNDSDLANLAGIPSSDFDVIQMTPSYPGWDSATAPTGSAPTISSFTASATNVSSGSPVTFNFSVSGDSYDYIDMIGPVRLTSGSGSVTIYPTATQTYTLYSVNQYGNNGSGAGNSVTVSTPITVVVTGSVLAPPTFSPAGGTYSSAQVVTLNSTTYPYATIYYTTNGSTPTTSSTQYPVIPQPMSAQSVGNVEDITVSTTQTIKAIAVAPGYSSPSAVSSATYTIN